MRFISGFHPGDSLNNYLCTLKLDNSTSQKINEHTEALNQLKLSYSRDFDTLKAETQENSTDVTEIDSFFHLITWIA